MGNRSKKKQIREKPNKKRSWLATMPVGLCAVMIVVGFIVGVVFVAIQWHEGAIIERNEAVSVTASYAGHTKVMTGKGIYDIQFVFHDHEALNMPEIFWGDGVKSALEQLQENEKLTMLLHPNSNKIWEIRTGECVILFFEDAKCLQKNDNIAGSVVMGTLGCLFIGMGIVSLLLQWKERRR